MRIFPAGGEHELCEIVGFRGLENVDLWTEAFREFRHVVPDVLHDRTNRSNRANRANRENEHERSIFVLFVLFVLCSDLCVIC